VSGAGEGHLSIGEVLSLVQEEFPDVTISKIRFLESQGLIAPERTGAGYRKFYDSDIERLRWILRQQRDHFLPLKVIRKMLDQGIDVSPESGEQPTLWSAAASGPASEASNGSRREGLVSADDGSGATIDVTDSARLPSEAAVDAGPPPERSAAHPAVASARPRRSAPDAEAVRERPTSRATGGSGASGGSGGSGSSGASGGASGAGASDQSGTGGGSYTSPADVVAALQEQPPTGRGSGRGGGAGKSQKDQARRSKRRRTADMTDLRLSRAEFCDASGVSAEFLTDLEQFGLVEPVLLGGDPQYDGAALEVARLAARYAELGVGARHLRMYKVAAEREAGFIEQLVVPLIKQRNPAAREQAGARTEELTEIGAELHAALLRRRLGPGLAP
jgi:DNA-binding transcriptional MerR regulator